MLLPSLRQSGPAESEVRKGWMRGPGGGGVSRRPEYDWQPDRGERGGDGEGKGET